MELMVIVILAVLLVVSAAVLWKAQSKFTDGRVPIPALDHDPTALCGVRPAEDRKTGTVEWFVTPLNIRNDIDTVAAVEKELHDLPDKQTKEELDPLLIRAKEMLENLEDENDRLCKKYEGRIHNASQQKKIAEIMALQKKYKASSLLTYTIYNEFSHDEFVRCLKACRDLLTLDAESVTSASGYAGK